MHEKDLLEFCGAVEEVVSGMVSHTFPREAFGLSPTLQHALFRCTSGICNTICRDAYGTG